jgi:hypothetical protein
MYVHDMFYHAFDRFSIARDDQLSSGAISPREIATTIETRVFERGVKLVFAFDTLSYAQHLRSSGIPQDQAEAHAEAARQFIMAELVTKTDLNDALERWSLKISVRLGIMLAAGIAALAAIVKLS